jgi:hypothetical protein
MIETFSEHLNSRKLHRVARELKLFKSGGSQNVLDVLSTGLSNFIISQIKILKWGGCLAMKTLC